MRMPVRGKLMRTKARREPGTGEAWKAAPQGGPDAGMVPWRGEGRTIQTRLWEAMVHPWNMELGETTVWMAQPLRWGCARPASRTVRIGVREQVLWPITWRGEPLATVRTRLRALLDGAYRAGLMVESGGGCLAPGGRRATNMATWGTGMKHPRSSPPWTSFTMQ